MLSSVTMWYGCSSVVDVSVCNGLVDGVEHMLREDVGDITGDTKKVYQFVITILNI